MRVGHVGHTKVLCLHLLTFIYLNIISIELTNMQKYLKYMKLESKNLKTFSNTFE